MFEFTVTERSVARQFRARVGSISEFGGKSTNDLGETERKLLTPAVELYEKTFEDEINKKIDELGSMNRATKKEWERCKYENTKPVELQVSYKVLEKNAEGLEVSVRKYCIWKETNSVLRWYRADSNWTKVGNGRDIENVANFQDLYPILKKEVELLDEKLIERIREEELESDLNNPYVQILIT